MRWMPSSAQRIQTRRTRPTIEGLEDRRLLSGTSLRHSASTATASTGGVLSKHGTQFTYTTATGGLATIRIDGLGSLAGTSVDSSGALHLVFGGTNAYSKIESQVHGGGGVALLASIENSQLIAANATTSLSGVGGNVLAAAYLAQYDLIAGGTINLTSGVNTVVLNAVGPDTQIQLRQLPPAPSPSSSSTSTSTSLASVTTSSGTTGAEVTTKSSSSSTPTSATTLEAGQSATITNDGVTATYESAANGSQTLTSISGTFTPGTNIVEPLPTGTPGQTPRPAPPGVILKVRQIDGDTTGATDLLTDPVIFGYDPITGDVIAFKINLNTDTATQDTTFTPIPVPGDPVAPGLNLGWNGTHLDVLVSSGTTVYAFNATTGAADGSFTTVNSFLGTQSISGIGSADNVTVLGSGNSLTMIDLTKSIKTGIAQPEKGSPASVTPSAGITLLGGVTGLPGSTSVIATVSGTFNTLQSTQQELGTQSFNTTSIKIHHKKKSETPSLKYSFTPATASAVLSNGAYTPVTLPTPTIPGSAFGSIDQNTALVTGVSSGANSVQLSSGMLTIDYPNQLLALSEAFRPDLRSSALIDIQGDVQSVRGNTATGMVLNDNGNLNLVQFNSVTNSTIVGQPLSHLNIVSRSHVTALTPSRTINGSDGSFPNDGRNGVTVDTSLKPIGPLSQPNDESA